MVPGLVTAEVVHHVVGVSAGQREGLGEPCSGHWCAGQGFFLRLPPLHNPWGGFRAVHPPGQALHARHGGGSAGLGPQSPQGSRCEGWEQRSLGLWLAESWTGAEETCCHRPRHAAYPLTLLTLTPKQLAPESGAPCCGLIPQGSE